MEDAAQLEHRLPVANWSADYLVLPGNAGLCDTILQLRDNIRNRPGYPGETDEEVMPKVVTTGRLLALAYHITNCRKVITCSADLQRMLPDNQAGVRLRPLEFYLVDTYFVRRIVTVPPYDVFTSVDKEVTLYERSSRAALAYYQPIPPPPRDVWRSVFVNRETNAATEEDKAHMQWVRQLKEADDTKYALKRAREAVLAPNQAEAVQALKEQLDLALHNGVQANYITAVKGVLELAKTSWPLVIEATEALLKPALDAAEAALGAVWAARPE